MVTAIVIGGALALHNVVGNLVVPPALYVPVNLALAAVLVALARWAGRSPDELGLGRAHLARGLAAGGALAVAVAVAIGLALLVPLTRPLFEDRRVAGVDGLELAYRTLVRIPLGTAVLEEVAFRGVLLAQLRSVATTTVAVAWSSVLFGLWHVIPTVEALRVNDVTGGPVAQALAVGAAVAVTAVAGVAFCWLRLRTGSLVAPALVHTATNSVSTVAAYLALLDVGGRSGG